MYLENTNNLIAISEHLQSEGVKPNDQISQRVEKAKDLATSKPLKDSPTIPSLIEHWASLRQADLLHLREKLTHRL